MQTIKTKKWVSLRVNFSCFLICSLKGFAVCDPEGGVEHMSGWAARQINKRSGKKELNRAVFSGIWTRTIDERPMMEWMNVKPFIKNWGLCHQICFLGLHNELERNEQMQAPGTWNKRSFCQCKRQSTQLSKWTWSSSFFLASFSLKATTKYSCCTFCN